MLFDRVDAVRRSAAEQLIMAARIDLDRCPLRLLHHVPGACPGQDGGLPSLSSSPSAAAAAAVTIAGVAPDAEAGSAGGPIVPLNGEGETPPLATGGAVEAAAGAGGSSGSLAAEETSASPLPGNGGDDAEVRIEEPPNGEGAAAATAEKTPGGGERDSGGAPAREGLDVGGGGDGGGARSGAVPVEEPWDRAGACGLWLRMVIVPLLVECLDGSYRTKLLALHMTQVRR